MPVGGKLYLALDVLEEDVEENDWIVDASLRVWRDGVGETLYPLLVEQLPGGGRRFYTEFYLPSEPGLLWYYFLLHAADGQLLFYGNNQRQLGGEGALSLNEPPSYQVTLYKKSEAPEWFSHSICYQIFPDRFSRGADWQECQQRAAEPLNWQGNSRVVQQNWYDKPFYTYNERGEVVRWAFFGGNLEGIREKLLYLKSLGVSSIYLNPIFLASSNHKYDTADYRQIDPAFGDDESFKRLAVDAAELGISLILDGVFSHTGEDSRYFNKFGNFPDVGACQSQDSPYYHWYKFTNYPNEYKSWWGVGALPEVDENAEDYRSFIYGDEDSVVRHWLRLGARGWRLDVADELPDDFIVGLAAAAKAEKPDALVLGEVWEDASNKQSYGVQRRYLLGDELDSTMNYPFRTAALDFLLGRIPAAELVARLLSLKENYPPSHFAAALNLLGTHDTPRVLTVLGEAPEISDKAEAENFRLSPEKRELAVRRLRLLSALQFTMPGVPCIYYGDEVGVQGLADPFNRGSYPWGREDLDILGWYRRMAYLRQEYPLLQDGDFQPLASGEGVYACRRFWQENTQGEYSDNDYKNKYINKEEIFAFFNRENWQTKAEIALPEWAAWGMELLSGREIPLKAGQEKFELDLPPFGCEVWLFRSAAPEISVPERAAGVLCHLTSLPHSDEGWHDAARRFIDYLAMAGQKLWQVLPLNPVGESRSPYTAKSVFAKHEGLAQESERRADWNIKLEMEYLTFCKEQEDWLEDYALFSAISESRAGLPWQQWPDYERDRRDLPLLRIHYAARMEECKKRQFLFWREWQQVKAYANKRGVKIIGDLPIYAAPGGADVWANRDLFLLDEQGYPLVGAGVPPDYFSVDGQNWGNPLYNWNVMKRDGYLWWRRRFAAAMQDFDYIRLDHFRSFAAFYAVPQGKTPKNGYWLKGPGHDFFRQIEAELGRLPILAEDLGLLDTEVANLLRLTGYPGMAVYQFETEKLDNLPTDLPPEQFNRAVYTGTHDNQTIVGWLSSRGFEDSKEIAQERRAILRRLYDSPAPWVIIPLQDVFGVGDEARMNVPGISAGNWTWQTEWNEFKLTVVAELNSLVRRSGR
jgi:4-alpha-glucanotransferase